MTRDSPILIIGGGLGGLALAVGLAGRGFPVRVFEQARELREIGAGLTVSGGAMRALDWLGIGDIVRRRSERAANLPRLHYATGALIAGAYDVSALRDDGAPNPRDWKTRHMHRADLHEALRERLFALDPDALALGHAFIGAEALADGVTARFANGETAQGRVLIGCDGSRSGRPRPDVPRRGAGIRRAGHVALHDPD